MNAPAQTIPPAILRVVQSKDQTKAFYNKISSHEHFPHFLDCRPIYVQTALERAGFKTRKALKKPMWIPVEIVLCRNE